MIILGKLILIIAKLLEIAINIYYWMLIIRVVISWLPVNRHNQLVILLENLTDPVLDFLKRYIPVLRTQAGSMGIDFTPLVAIVLLYLIEVLVVSSLFDLANMLL